jgi:hypothetical protein
LQETERAVQAQVDKLSMENKRLSTSIDQLSGSVDHLTDIRQALSVITNTQGQSIDAFRNQVEQNKQTLKQMKSNHKAAVLQNIMSVVLRSDKDGDLVMDESEVEGLLTKLQRMNGVTIREDRFRAALSGKSVQSVMNLAKDLLNEPKAGGNKIFEIQK